MTRQAALRSIKFVLGTAYIARARLRCAEDIVQPVLASRHPHLQPVSPSTLVHAVTPGPCWLTLCSSWQRRVDELPNLHVAACMYAVKVLDPRERVYPGEADPVHKMRFGRLQAYNQVSTLHGRCMFKSCSLEHPLNSCAQGA